MGERYFILCIVSCLPLLGNAQGDSINLVTNLPKKYCNPTLTGMSPSKGFSFSYERVGDSHITSVSRDTAVGNSSATMERNNRFELNAKIPFITKGKVKLIGGFRYFYEDFIFKNPSGFSDYPLYVNLQKKHLKSIGINLTMLNSINEKKFWIARGDFDLNGDYTNNQLPTSSFIKVSAAFLYGWKKCETKSTGIGIFVNYALGRQMIIPVYLFNNTFNKHWGIEALLPAYFKGRYNFSDKALLLFGYDVEGASYNLSINNPAIKQYQSLQLRKSNLRFLAEYQRELYKIVWFNISVGVRQPVNFNITTRHDRGGYFSFSKFAFVPGNQLIRNTLSLAPFINAGIFITPPKTSENKVVNSKEGN
jgi:hypothetical protein